MRTPIPSASTVVVVLFLAAAALHPAPAAAQEEPKKEEKATGWSDSGELSYVLTSGNSEGSTVGFKNTLLWTGERSALTVKAGALRADTTTTTRTATLIAPGEFQVVETRLRKTTAESLFLNGRYDRKISDRFFWYSGAGWDRNRFAGIQNRYVVEAGVGNLWVDREDLKFKTHYAATFTDQEDVVEDPAASDTFAGLRISWDYLDKFGPSATFTHSTIIDENLDATSDWRANMTNAVAVAINEVFALKVSLQWLYDNEPSFELVPVTNPPPTEVPVALDELDTLFNVALVANF